MIKFGRQLSETRVLLPAAGVLSTISTCRCNAMASCMSPHAHARIKRIDTTKVKAAPGVLAVLTSADVEADKLGAFSPIMPEDMGGPKGYRTLRSILAIGKVRALGERVVFVVVETLFQVKNVVKLVEVI